MNKITGKHQYRAGFVRFMKRYLIWGMIVLIPCFIVISASTIHAISSPRGYVVTTIAPSGSTNVRYSTTSGRTSSPARDGERLNQPTQRLILLRNTRSSVSMQSIPRSRERSVIYNATSGDRQVQFHYPCSAEPPFVLAWSSGTSGGCSPPGLFVGSTRWNRTAGVPSRSVDVAQTSKDLLNAQNFWNDLLPGVLAQVNVEYCSYVEESGSAWSAKASAKGPLIDTGNPCQQAEEQCLKRASPGNECFVASAGEWPLSNPELVFSLDCADNYSFKTTSPIESILGSLVLQVDEIAQQIGGNACVLNLFPPGGMIVEPATDQPTIFQARDLNDRVAIDALKGDLAIRAAETPQGEPLILPEGSTYEGGAYDGDQYFEGSPYSSERTYQEVWNNPVILDALNADGSFQVGKDISPEIATEMATQQQAFQDTLRQLHSSQVSPFQPPR